MDSLADIPIGNRFDAGLLSEAKRIVGARLRENAPGRDLTTYAIGGPVRALISIESGEELAAVLALLWRHGQPHRVLGRGSNCLIADAGLDEWVIKLGSSFRNVQTCGAAELRVGGAAALMNLARRASDDGLSGLEFAAGIPASVGGAAFMNAGAHGSELSDRILLIEGVLSDGTARVWKRDELPWRYRHSGLPAGAVVTEVVLSLVEGDKQRISALCSHNLAERKARQPLSLASAGSVFKNPSPDSPAGRLIEAAGLKGQRVGGAVVSELHGNWIVNPERRATAADVLGLIEVCQRRVLESSGISLEPEVRLWGCEAADTAGRLARSL